MVVPEGHALTSLQELLSTENCRPVPAHNGEVARAWAEGMEPALAVVDIESPRSGGLKLLDELRALHRDTVLVVLSPSDADGLELADLGRLGVYRVLTKPWNDEELRFTVRLGLHYRDLVRKSRMLAKRVEQRLEEWRGIEKSDVEEKEKSTDSREGDRPLIGAYPTDSGCEETYSG
jgi:DNA-binding response OmpR family regulator